jgi:hypothetical protein
MAAPNWEYKRQIGPLIDDITLAGLGAQGWELVTILPPMVSDSVLTGLAQQDKNSFAHFFKRPV